MKRTWKVSIPTGRWMAGGQLLPQQEAGGKVHGSLEPGRGQLRKQVRRVLPDSVHGVARVRPGSHATHNLIINPATKRNQPMTIIIVTLAELVNADLASMSLDGLATHYNELVVASGQGTKRHAKFRDKPTGIKAIKALLVQIKSTPPATPMEEIRQEVVASQKAALTAARVQHDKVDPVKPKSRTPKNETDPVPVAQRGPKSKAPAPDATLEVLVDNPKREEARKARFDCYGGTKGDRTTVGNYINAIQALGGAIDPVGDRRQALKDIVRDIRKGYIRVAS